MFLAIVLIMSFHVISSKCDEQGKLFFCNISDLFPLCTDFKFNIISTSLRNLWKSNAFTLPWFVKHPESVKEKQL